MTNPSPPACPYCRTPAAREVLPARVPAIYECAAPGCRLRFGRTDNDGEARDQGPPKRRRR